MGTYCNDTPLIDICPVDLDFIIGAASSVSIVASGHIDFISHYRSSGISYTFEGDRGYMCRLINNSSMQINMD